MATQYVFPVNGTIIENPSHAFSANRSGGGRNHAGNDFRAANGSPAVAVVGGTVQYAGHNQGYQWNAVVLGDDGNAYRYATHGPLNVKTGQRVEAGQQVGVIDRSHLHFEVIPSSSPAYAQMKANPGQFVSTSWRAGGKPVTIDPHQFLGVPPGTKMAAGTVVGPVATQVASTPPLPRLRPSSAGNSVDQFAVADPFQAPTVTAFAPSQPRAAAPFDAVIRNGTLTVADMNATPRVTSYAMGALGDVPGLITRANMNTDDAIYPIPSAKPLPMPPEQWGKFVSDLQQGKVSFDQLPASWQQELASKLGGIEEARRSYNTTMVQPPTPRLRPRSDATLTAPTVPTTQLPAAESAQAERARTAQNLAAVKQAVGRPPGGVPQSLAGFLNNDPAAVNRAWWGDQNPAQKGRGEALPGSVLKPVLDAYKSPGWFASEADKQAAAGPVRDAMRPIISEVINYTRDNPLLARQMAAAATSNPQLWDAIITQQDMQKAAAGGLDVSSINAIKLQFASMVGTPLNAGEARREASGLQGYVPPSLIPTPSRPAPVPISPKPATAAFRSYTPFTPTPRTSYTPFTPSPRPTASSTPPQSYTPFTPAPSGSSSSTSYTPFTPAPKKPVPTVPNSSATMGIRPKASSTSTSYTPFTPAPKPTATSYTPFTPAPRTSYTPFTPAPPPKPAKPVVATAGYVSPAAGARAAAGMQTYTPPPKMVTPQAKMIANPAYKEWQATTQANPELRSILKAPSQFILGPTPAPIMVAQAPVMRPTPVNLMTAAPVGKPVAKAAVRPASGGGGGSSSSSSSSSLPSNWATPSASYTSKTPSGQSYTVSGGTVSWTTPSGTTHTAARTF